MSDGLNMNPFSCVLWRKKLKHLDVDPLHGLIADTFVYQNTVYTSNVSKIFVEKVEIVPSFKIFSSYWSTVVFIQT